MDGVTMVFTILTGAGTMVFTTETLITTTIEEILIDLITTEETTLIIILTEIIEKEATATITRQQTTIEALITLTIRKNKKHIDVVATPTHTTGQTATALQLEAPRQEGLVIAVKDPLLALALDRVLQEEVKDLVQTVTDDKTYTNEKKNHPIHNHLFNNSFD